MAEYTITLIETPDNMVEGLAFTCADVEFTARVLEEARKYLPPHKLVPQVDEEEHHTGIHIVFKQDKKGLLAKRATGFFVKAIRKVVEDTKEPVAGPEPSDEV